MIAENMVVQMSIQEEIEITCKKCNKSQKYHPRGSKIPKRPKTQCQNEDCGAWIYFDASLLVKDDQRPNDQMTKTDQKQNLKKSSKPRIKAKDIVKSEKEVQVDLTKKVDQRPIKYDQIKQSENYQELLVSRNHELVNYINGMFNEVQSYGRVIPIDTKQSIVNGVLDNLLNLMKGLKYYLNAWESRYNRYLEEKPENPLIDDYRDMQNTLDFLLKLKKLKELIQKFKKSNL
ncbi:MAG: hypothetical protein Lokiarch_31980 [Candidatus Lokiarchaeum sp. GC14_75]|nr:MAG: hypothetical protein Lokiarch_31980 [Candidatus Lokiarchaeum sp. GC14_75]